MSELNLKLIGDRIRDLRKQRGLSQEQLAELANFHYTYIGGVERAEKNITILNLIKIANALNVALYDLFEYTKLKSRAKSKADDLDKILNLLLTLNSSDVKKVKNILMEMFD